MCTRQFEGIYENEFDRGLHKYGAEYDVKVETNRKTYGVFIYVDNFK